MAENNIYIHISLKSHYYFLASSNGNLTLNCQLPSQINNCDSLTSTEEPTTTTEEPTTMTEEPTTITEQTTTTRVQAPSIPITFENKPIVQPSTDKLSTNSKLNIVSFNCSY